MNVQTEFENDHFRTNNIRLQDNEMQVLNKQVMKYKRGKLFIIQKWRDKTSV